MQGENDDHLSWPFTGTVLVELLNQLKDNEHHSMCLDFSKNTRSNKRVLGTEMADSGYGHPQFIAHSSLDYDSERHCQYLMNDCLYFRFKTEAVGDPPKPWLSACCYHILMMLV